MQDDCFCADPDQSIIDEVIQAYIDGGMRVRFALDQPEVSELKKLPFLADIVSDDLKRAFKTFEGQFEAVIRILSVLN